MARPTRAKLAVRSMSASFVAGDNKLAQPTYALTRARAPRSACSRGQSHRDDDLGCELPARSYMITVIMRSLPSALAMELERTMLLVVGAIVISTLSVSAFEADAGARGRRGGARESSPPASGSPEPCVAGGKLGKLPRALA